MSPMVSITNAGLVTIAQRADGVIAESTFSQSGAKPSVNNWIIYQDTEVSFELHLIRNGIAQMSDYSFQPYDVKSVNGVPAIYFDFAANNGADPFPQNTAKFICQCFVFSKYPGIDCNSVYVEARGITNDWVIVVGTTEAIEFDEKGY